MVSTMRKLGIDRPERPSGHAWVAFRRRLLAVGGPFWGQPCFLCGHSFNPGQHREIEHRISPGLRPDLAWDARNMAVVHCAARGGRCATCGVACNSVAVKPRDELGRSVPWDAAFIARKSDEARAMLAGRAGKPLPARAPARASARPRPADAGREW